MPSLFRIPKSLSAIAHVLFLACVTSLRVHAEDVSTWADLKAAVAGGKTPIEIKANLTADSTTTITNPVTINGNGFIITGPSSGRIFSINTTGKVIFNKDDGKAIQPLDGSLTFSGSSDGAVSVVAGTVEFYRTSFIANGNPNIDGGAVEFKGTKLLMNSCTLDGNKGDRGGSINSNAPVVIVNSTFKNSSDSVYFDSGENTQGSALINNKIVSDVALGWGTNTFHYNNHSGTLTPTNTLPAPTGQLSGGWGDFPKFDAGRPSGGFWERHFRLDKEDDKQVDVGPLESSSRPPLKFGILDSATSSGVPKPAVDAAITLADSSVTYGGGWSNDKGKPDVSVTPAVVEDNTAAPTLFIPEDESVQIVPDLSNFPGVEVKKIMVDGNDVTSTGSFLAGASGVTNSLHDIRIEFQDITYTLGKGDLKIIDPETGAIGDAGGDVTLSFPDSAVPDQLSPGETITVHLKHGKGYAPSRIAFADVNASRRASDNVLTDNGDLDTGLTFDVSKGDDNNTYYTLEVTDGLASLAKDDNDGNESTKTVTLSFTLTQPLYILDGIVDPNATMPTIANQSHPTGTIADKGRAKAFLPASEVLNHRAHLEATPHEGYNFVGWLKWEDYNATIKANTDPGKLHEELRALGEAKFLTGLNPESRVLDKNMSDADVGPDFIFHVVALFEPKLWEIDVSDQFVGADGEEIPADIDIKAFTTINGQDTLVHYEDVKSSDGRYYDGTKLHIEIRPDKAYKFLGIEGYLHSTSEDNDGRVYHNLTLTMTKNFIPKFEFEKLDFRMEQVVQFGRNEGAIMTTTRYGLGAIVKIELGDVSGYAFDGWKLEKYSRLTGDLDPVPIWDKNGTPASLEISSDGKPLVREANATGENNSTIEISGIRDDYRLTTYYKRRAVVVNTQVIGNGSIDPNTADRTYTVGDTLQLVAKPGFGFRFVEWKDDNNKTIGTDVQYDFDSMKTDQNATAVFAPEEYTVTSDPLLPPGFGFNSTAVRDPDTNKSTLITDGPYFYGEEVSISDFVPPLGWIDKGLYSFRDENNQTLRYTENNNSAFSFVIYSDVTIRAELDPDLSDKDRDGLTNHQEFEIWKPDPNAIRSAIGNPDYDGDEFSDGWEVRYGFDPKDESSPKPDEDADGDGLTNLEEHDVGTNPEDKDTDADGFTDSYEVKSFRRWDPVEGNFSVAVAKKSKLSLSGVLPDDLGAIVRFGTTDIFEGKQSAVENEVLRLFADSADEYDFLNWSLTWDANASDKVKEQLEDLDGTSLNPLPLEVHANVKVEALFVPKGSFFSVQVSVAPHPHGSVGAVNIQPNFGIYLADTNVTIKAIPEIGYVFGGWTGDLNRTANPLLITLDRSLALEANFYEEGSVLRVDGTVSKIDDKFPGEIKGLGVASPGQKINLLAKANPGYLFKSWEGDISGSENNVSVTVNDHLTIVATFKKDYSDDDSDGLDNFSELVFWDTNHSNPDSDGDGLSDKFEVDNSTSLDPNVSQLRLLEFIRADPGSFGIPVSSEPTVEVDERNDLYRFIDADKGVLLPSVPDTADIDDYEGWFYTAAHGWSWISPDVPGYLYNAEVQAWVLLVPHIKRYDDKVNVTSDFGVYDILGKKYYNYPTNSQNSSNANPGGSGGSSGSSSPSSQDTGFGNL